MAQASTQPSTRTEFDAVARHWYVRTDAVEGAHFTRCARFRNRHLWLGCITISCTALLGVLANHQTAGLGIDSLHHYLLPLLTVIAPILAGLVSFLRLDEKSTLHHNAAGRFASMKRRLDIMISECTTERDLDEVRHQLRDICEKWDALTAQAPALYRAEWKGIDRQIKKNEADINKYHPIIRREVQVPPNGNQGADEPGRVERSVFASAAAD
jgi:hypothetical protein